MQVDRNVRAQRNAADASVLDRNRKCRRTRVPISKRLNVFSVCREGRVTLTKRLSCVSEHAQRSRAATVAQVLLTQRVSDSGSALAVARLAIAVSLRS